uniref:SDR family NAD(P)-dependent oxidoreductase n=1 Tax=Streptomyces odonnellii TaxID=1417980 RepID=UPI0006250A8D
MSFLPAGTVYSATKSYVLTFTQALQQKLADTGIRVQAFLSGAVRTEFWDGSGVELAAIPDELVMSVDDAVDAAFAGLGRPPGQPQGGAAHRHAFVHRSTRTSVVGVEQQMRALPGAGGSW